MVNRNDRWSALSMKERADLMNMYITNGISDLKEMKKHYNSFGDGGDTESSVDGGEIEASIITPRQSKINKRRMRKELFTKIKSTLESDGDIIQLYNELPEDQRKRALESIMKFSSAADPKIVKDWFIEEAKKHPLKAIKALNYVITGEGQPVLFEPNRKYAYNGLFGGDYYFDKQTPIDNGILDAMLYNKEINSNIGVQADKQDYGPEVDYINRVYPDKNIQYIETRPGINLDQEGIQPTIYYGAQGSFKTSLPKRVINNQGIIIQEGVRNDSTFVRGLDVYDFKPDEYMTKWVRDSSMFPVIKQIDEDTNPVAIKTPWVYKDNINDIISSRTGLNGFEFNTIDSDKSVYKGQKSLGGKLNNFATGGHTEEGGYSDKSKWYREVRHSKLDPAGGLGIDQLFYLSNHSKGDEDQYWRAYLGLENSLPKMNPSSKTEWDDKIEAEKIANGELPSDFYGTTNNMDLYLQAMADTTTTGKIVRNYDEFKKLNPTLSPKKEIEAMYHSGKAMMDNPNKWTQVGEVKGSAQLDIERKLNDGEEYPLGMLASFGAKWIPEKNTIHIHDTYDFPWYSRILGRIPERPKEMKIRGKVKYNPKKQAKLFNADNFNLVFPK